MRRSAPDDDDLPLAQSTAACPWENPTTAKQIDEILISLEAPPVDAEVRLKLQKLLYRRDYFGGDGRGHVTLLIRTILESEGNGASALFEPIISAVSMVMEPRWTEQGLRWIEAWDAVPLMSILQTLRDLLGEQDLWRHYCHALRRKIARILEPAQAKPRKPVKVKREPKPPLAVTRVPAIEKAIVLGVELLALRESISCNKKFARELRRRLPAVDPITASETMKVARYAAGRPEIYRRLSWIALFEISSPKMSASVRQAMEAKILAGQSVTAPQIRRARGPLKPGSVKRRPVDQPAQRMAA